MRSTFVPSNGRAIQQPPGGELARLLRQFSGTQGLYGWSYGYFTSPLNPATFTTTSMTFNPSDGYWKGPDAAETPFVAPGIFHPGVTSHGGLFYSAVARYAVGVTKTVKVKIEASLSDTNGNNTLNAYLNNNTTPIVGLAFAPGDLSHKSNVVTGVSVVPGDFIYLAEIAGASASFDALVLVDMTIT